MGNFSSSPKNKHMYLYQDIFNVIEKHNFVYFEGRWDDPNEDKKIIGLPTSSIRLAEISDKETVLTAIVGEGYIESFIVHDWLYPRK